VGMKTLCALAWPLIAFCAGCAAAAASPSAAGARPACGVTGYVLQTGYRFGTSAKLLPGEIAVRSTADMVSLGWKHEAAWGNPVVHSLDRISEFYRPAPPSGPNYVFEADDLAIVARHDGTDNYGADKDKPDYAGGHVTSGGFITALTVEPPAVVEFMVMAPEGRGMWPSCWLYDCHSGRHDASEIDVMESEFNAPIGQRDDRSKVFQFDHGRGVGRTIVDPGGLDRNKGWWQPYGSLSRGDTGSDLSKRWVAYSVWWQGDRVGKYVDDKPGITRAFKWTGPAWPNILVNNACGGIEWTGPISPETFAGDNSTMRIKWIRIFMPVAGSSGRAE
jgi:beta-glucanase (GH16 family)